MNRRDYVFYAKPVRRPASVTRMLPRFSTWAERGAATSWARSASDDTDEGISSIENGIEDYRATGSMVILPYFLALKAEALHLADRTPEALEAIYEAEALSERSEVRFWCAELNRLRALFLTTMGADEAQIEVSFRESIRIANEQKSISLAKRAEATYAEYRSQKAIGSGGHGFRLALG